jgi:hypothetical protein
VYVRVFEYFLKNHGERWRSFVESGHFRLKRGVSKKSVFITIKKK